MPTWNSRGLRGASLEELINTTNEKYREKKLALVQKIPTPIKPVKIDKDTRQITLAFFEQKSTVDYIGIAQGYAIAFDAKECAKETFPLANIHPHQVQFMKEFEEQNGISFLIIYFSQKDVYYYLRYFEMQMFFDRVKEGSPKQFRFDELNPEYIIERKGFYLCYLDCLNKDLMERSIVT